LIPKQLFDLTNTILPCRFMTIIASGRIPEARGITARLAWASAALALFAVQQ
jgi:hypothetical protein